MRLSYLRYALKTATDPRGLREQESEEPDFSPQFSLCSKDLCIKPPTILRRSHSQQHRMILKEVRMESTISTEDLKAKLDRKDPVKVVETLAPERYREAHLPGALNIPPEQIKELAPQLLPNKDAEIVTYCTSLH
jgi:hypothetical protein